MSVLLTALKKAAESTESHGLKQRSEKSQAPIYSRPVKNAARTEAAITLPWEQIAKRRINWSSSSHQLQQKLDALQQKIQRHQQQYLHYQQTLSQQALSQQVLAPQVLKQHDQALIKDPLVSEIIPPTMESARSRLLTPSLSAAAVQQLFAPVQFSAVPSEVQFERHPAFDKLFNPNTLPSMHTSHSLWLNMLCLSGLLGLAGILWQNQLNDTLDQFIRHASQLQANATPNFSANSIQARENSSPATQTSSVTETSFVQQQAVTQQPTQTLSDPTEASVTENNAENDYDSNTDIAHISSQQESSIHNPAPTYLFVEPPLPRMIIKKNLSPSKDNSTAGAQLSSTQSSSNQPKASAEQLLQNAQQAWTENNKLAAANAFKQFQILSREQPQLRQSSFEQLFNTGYYELAFYLLQTNIQQAPLNGNLVVSNDIFHLFKLIPNLPLETLEPFFIQLSQQYPKQSLLHFGLGNLYALHQQWSKAYQQFLHTTQVDPHNPDAFFNTAISAEHLQKTQQAREAYQQALELSKQHAFNFPAQIATERLALLQQQKRR